MRRAGWGAVAVLVGVSGLALWLWRVSRHEPAPPLATTSESETSGASLDPAAAPVPPTALGVASEESRGVQIATADVTATRRPTRIPSEPADGTREAEIAARRKQIAENEKAVVEALQGLMTAEEQFKQQVLVDQDGDGMGEYGWLGELAGVDPIRVTDVRCSASPFIVPALGQKDGIGVVRHAGYCLRLLLPTGSGSASGETEYPPPVAGNSADADDQEVRYACYAWPLDRGTTGMRTFLASHFGDVYATDSAVRAYSGPSSGPSADAAFDRAGARPENLDAGLGLAAAGLTARDGNTWVTAAK